MENKEKFIFFGTPDYSVYTLDSLSANGYIPHLIVTAPDRPVGRHFTITPSDAKVWALKHNVPTLEVEKFTKEIIEDIKSKQADLFIVSAYGKILPKELLEIPKIGTLNVHPSLLPLYRGPAPEKGPLLNGDKETGVTIILLDEMVDHGPILLQKKVPLTGTETTPEIAKVLFTMGGQMLAEIIPKWIEGKVELKNQDHTKATLTKKVTKQDGLIDPNGDPLINYNKYRAYSGWPGIYFFQDGKRIKVTKAHLEDGKFIIERIIPEGKKEIDYKNKIQN
ncbi:methionyl-tRNA formyltransferase [Candidatus Nomurabacteria bacterium]|nr:methionyl-tRNA formyltransferase [Candidatus Nomurabacteria bacterium]